MTRQRPGGDSSRPPAEPALPRHEEEAVLERQWREEKPANVRRIVQSRKVDDNYPARSERLAHDRVAARDGDSGEIEVLPDGSVSIPLFEEQLVVSRRVVLRERVVVKKEMITNWRHISAHLRSEEIELEQQSDSHPIRRADH